MATFSWLQLEMSTKTFTRGNCTGRRAKTKNAAGAQSTQTSYTPEAAEAAAQVSQEKITDSIHETAKIMNCIQFV